MMFRTQFCIYSGAGMSREGYVLGGLFDHHYPKCIVRCVRSSPGYGLRLLQALATPTLVYFLYISYFSPLSVCSPPFPHDGHDFTLALVASTFHVSVSLNSGQSGERYSG